MSKIWSKLYTNAKIMNHRDPNSRKLIPTNINSNKVFTLKTIVNNHLNAKKGNKLFACFIDLRKAYDLFYKLNGINGSFLTLIKDLYAKTRCAVKIYWKRTDFFNYTKGVRQGCPLSPLLFNIFINGIAKRLNKVNPHPLKLDKNLSCLLYADDLVIFSWSREGLQKSLDAAADFFSKWNRDISYDKTKCITFNKRGDKGKHVFKINGNPLENVKFYKYLGIHISSKNCSLKWTLRDLSVKANRALFGLKTNLNLMKMPIKLLFKTTQWLSLFCFMELRCGPHAVNLPLTSGTKLK